MELFGVSRYQAAQSAYAPQKDEAAAPQKEAAVEEKKAAAQDTVALSGNADYLQTLQKQFPKMSFSIGTGFTGKTKLNTGDNANRWAFTVSPKLLEKMRTDPEAEAEYTQRLRDIARATALAESFSKASGMKTVYCENYIDENGKLHHMSISVRKDGLNEKLRKEAQENVEKHIERVRGKNKEAAAKLEELLDKAEESGELTLGDEEMRRLGSAAKAADALQDAAQKSKEADEEEVEDEGMSGGRSSVGINAAKLARMLAAAKTRTQVQAVIAKIQSDLQECEAGRQQGAEVDEDSVRAAESLLQEAKSRLSSAENREATPEEEMASALASLM